jgi:signal transduction histidine kinase
VRAGHAARVAAVTTAAITVVYVVCVTVLNVVISARLTGQTDARLGDQLTDLRRAPAALASQVSQPGTGPGNADGDRDRDDGPLISTWLIAANGTVTAQSPGAPPLPASVVSGARGWPPMTVSLGQAGTYRLEQAQIGGDLLVAGQSNAGDRRTEDLLLAGEVSAGPVLLLAMFAGALLIGLRAQAPVEQSRRRQLEFTADASHELRTPLSVIRAETDLALATPRKLAEYQDTLRRIHGETDRLRHLVEDMLWLARSDSQPLRRDQGPADLGTVARGSADRFRSVGPGVTASVPEQAVLINAPPEWIDRLAGVLLDNACRYAGPEGQVRISVDAGWNRVVLRVEDSGPGIPAEQRARLFDRFSRATETGSGAGLGLAIGDSVVRSTGGRWEVDDSPLGGARLAVSWRRAQHRRD